MQQSGRFITLSFFLLIIVLRVRGTAPNAEGSSFHKLNARGFYTTPIGVCTLLSSKNSLLAAGSLKGCRGCREDHTSRRGCHSHSRLESHQEEVGRKDKSSVFSIFEWCKKLHTCSGSLTYLLPLPGTLRRSSSDSDETSPQRNAIRVCRVHRSEARELCAC